MLAALGVYGRLDYGVRQRAREIGKRELGICLAVGAAPPTADHASNSTLTDLPTWMRRIASARSGAIDRIFI